MTHTTPTDEVIAALDAMETAMAEFEAEINNFEQRTGRMAKGGLIEEALTAVETASSDRDAALVEMDEADAATISAARSAWLAEAALKRAIAWLAAYRSE
jgi:hypothetical protein